MRPTIASLIPLLESLLLLLCTAMAPYLALQGGSHVTQPDIAAIEQAIALFLLLIAAGIVYLIGHRPNWFAFAPAWFQFEIKKPATTWPLFLPMLALAVYMPIINRELYEHLFLADTDFTNISAALNHTALGLGPLHTPFLRTGNTGSYLGHHFSPGLFTLVPLYLLGDFIQSIHIWPEGYRATHFLYAGILWSILVFALVVWARLTVIEIRNLYLAIPVFGAILLSFLLWRLALSYHSEILVLLFSGVAFYAKQTRRLVIFWCALFLWMSVKEDLAVYVFLYGLYVLSNKNEYRRLSFPLAILVCSAVYFVLTRFVLMDWFSGGTPMHWESFWSDVWSTAHRGHVSTVILLLISFSFLPLLQVRLFLLTILPILLLHLFSYHPWHRELLGHYGYAVLPFILLAFIRSARRVIGWFNLFERPSLSIPFMLLLLAAAMFGASRDAALPVLRQAPDPRYATVETLMQSIPAGSCVQTQSPFSAHAPLDVLVFPLMIPEQNAYHNKMPGPHNFETFHFEKPFCNEYYVLIDLNEVRIPDYTQEHVRAFDEYARNNMQLMVERGSVRLYRFTMIGMN